MKWNKAVSQAINIVKDWRVVYSFSEAVTHKGLSTQNSDALSSTNTPCAGENIQISKMRSPTTIFGHTTLPSLLQTERRDVVKGLFE